MDPTMKEYMEKITSSMDEFRVELRNNTAAVHANTAKLDDLLTWRPDLERHVAKLSDAVADLQQGRTPAAAASGVAATGLPLREPNLHSIGAQPEAAIRVQELPHGSMDHGDAFLHREKAPVTPPASLPGIVSDYIERFELIINHLASYSDTIHPYYYLTRFVEGLRVDIRAVVLIQRPADLDTACSLALLQEELTPLFGQEFLCLYLHHQQDLLHFRLLMQQWTVVASMLPRVDSSKVKALREYRRARGLCFKCGERWGHDHTCPTTVQLHVVEELLELFGIDTVFDTGQQQASEPECDTVMAISRQALTGGVSPKAFQLHAWIQGREILMLVDSGSSTSFVDEQLATQLTGVVALQTPGRVRVVGGGELICSSVIPHCNWFSHGHEFTTDMKVLPLGTYDAILGMDWLEDNSPMTVDWQAKRIELRVKGNIVCLSGHPSTTTCTVINSSQLHSLCRQGAISHMVQLHHVELSAEEHATIPPSVKEVVDQFEDVFGEPTSLPPRRKSDHHIQLIPGAQPVNIRPYRHKPEHKTEIEKQVDELLQSGVIRRSKSPFASPAILVKKKDGGPATFIESIQDTLQPVYRVCVLSFFDDILHLISAPVLALPDFTKLFVIETDACDAGIGAVLQQNGHPIAFMSKALCPRYRGLSTYEKEYLAVVVVVDQWRPYLQHNEFVIHTDQKSLVHLEEQHLTTPWQQKAFTKLLGLRYTIKYKKGVENGAADVLSRATHADSLNSISSCQPAWMADIITSYITNPQAQKLLEQLAVRPDPKGYFALDKGASLKPVLAAGVTGFPWRNIGTTLHFTQLLLIQQQLHRARNLMKQQADKKRYFRVFNVGDQVFLKLQPYIQTSVATRANHKLSYRFFGPYRIISRVNEVAYKLQLPGHSQVHPVFHVSQLRRALLPGTSSSTELPEYSDIPAVPTSVLERRWRKRRGAMVEQVRIRSSNPATVPDSWKDKEALRARFLQRRLGGKPRLKERGMSAALTGRPPRPVSRLHLLYSERLLPVKYIDPNPCS
ncbi:uncharacterized protein [Aegilops tauschii subsp. strangulata]|uniref:uncharacterized protein n=1 Tax=Aegilops tauschii subsp. strangulata TaxID=200361 RepID=UPI003CC8A388